MQSTSEEFNFIWLIWHNIVPFKDDSECHAETIGYVNDNPVNIAVRWTEMAGQLVAFVEAVSTVVDYRLVNAWIAKKFPGIGVYDTGNFHNWIGKIMGDTGDPEIKRRHRVIFDVLLGTGRD